MTLAVTTLLPFVSEPPALPGLFANSATVSAASGTATTLDFAGLLDAVAATVPPAGAGPVSDGPAASAMAATCPEAAAPPLPDPGVPVPAAVLHGWPAGKILPDEGAPLPPALPPADLPPGAIAAPTSHPLAVAAIAAAGQGAAQRTALLSPQTGAEHAALPAPREIPPPAAPQIAAPAPATMQPRTEAEAAVIPDAEANEANAAAPAPDPGTPSPPPMPAPAATPPSAPTPVPVTALVPAPPWMPVATVPASARAPVGQVLRVSTVLAGRGEVTDGGPAPVTLPAAVQGGQPDGHSPRPAAVPEGTTAVSFVALAAPEASAQQALTPLQPASPTAPATPLPDRPVAAPPATVPNAPQLDSAIAQVGDIREALRAVRPAMTLPHAEFGMVSLRLEPAAPDQWRAVLVSRDPGFVPAIHAALAERAVAAAADAAASSAGQQGAPQNGTSDHRYGASPNGGQGSSQPYPGQSGSRDGESAPDHRRPSTAAALAARGDDGAEEPGGRAPGAGGLFA